MLTRGRYWDRFDPDFLREEPYRRILRSRAMLFGSLGAGAIAYGIYTIIAEGGFGGWALVVAGALALQATRLMVRSLWDSRDLPRRDPPF